MNREDIIRMARESDQYADDHAPAWTQIPHEWQELRDHRFAALVAAAEREELEKELLKLKRNVVAPRDYTQGRWDLIGEFQDIIRARGKQ
jgi:hypothetical protein